MVTTPSLKAMSLTPVQSAKAKAGTSVNPLPISIPVAPVQLRNALVPIRVTLSGRLMAASAVQPAKASRPMDTVLPKSKFVSALQSVKARSAISAAPLPRVRLVSPVHPAKAVEVILVTAGSSRNCKAVQFWNAWSLMVAARGRSTVCSAVQSAKLLAPILVTAGRLTLFSPVQPTKASVLILVKVSVAVTCSKVVIPAKVSPRFFTPFSRCTERTPACLYFQSWPFVK